MRGEPLASATKLKAVILDVIDAGAEAVALFLARVDVIELDVVVEPFFAEGHRLVDLHGFRELSVRLQVPGLVGGVLQDDIGLAVLVVTKTNLS